VILGVGEVQREEGQTRGWDKADGARPANKAVQLTPLARLEPVPSPAGKRAAASSRLEVLAVRTFHALQFPVSPTLGRRLARCLFWFVPRRSTIPTPASGAADSWRWTAHLPTRLTLHVATVLAMYQNKRKGNYFPNH